MNYTLITGATGGLGKAFAELYAKDKNNLILVATKEDKLLEVKKQITAKYDVKVETLVADLSNQQEREKVFAFAKGLGFVDNLVNNAGFGDRTDFKNMDIALQLKMVEVNCSAVLYFTRMFMDEMLKQDQGHIINVGSISSFVPGPYFSTYHATKSFVLNLGESVAHEIRKTNVKLLTLCPGPFISGFVSKAGNDRVFEKIKPVSAKKVAKYGYKKSKQGKRVAVVGLKNKLTVFFPRLFSRNFVTSCSANTIKQED